MVNTARVPLKSWRQGSLCKYTRGTRAVDVQQKSLIDLKIKKKGVSKIGYYTYYHLSAHGDSDEKIKTASNRLAELMDYGVPEESPYPNSPFYWLNYDSLKWYDWENDMYKLSKEFPTIVFTLYGEGEDHDDTCRAFFKNGTVVFQKARIYYDPTPDWAIPMLTNEEVL